MTSSEQTARASRPAGSSTTPAEEVTDDQAWLNLELYDRLAEWEKKSPATAGELILLLKAERRHAHRMEWANWAKQLLGVILGFGCVIVMALLAWHYADVGSPLNGTVVMSAGTASIVTIFVTGRYVGRGGGSRRQ